jgi:type III secretion protein F
MSGVGNFNYGAINDSMGRASSTLERQVERFSQNMDPGSTTDLLKFQSMSQQWTMAISLQSTTVKMIGDALKGIVQKIG